MRIVICDDEPYYLEKVKSLVEENLEKEGIKEAEIATYTSGNAMCKDADFWEKCQVLFLDINMQDGNGVDIAYEIKQRNPNIYLVFVTAQVDHVLMGYRVEAFRYLLKDNLEDLMRECIPALLHKMKKENYSITCEFYNGARTIGVKDIVYIESFHHKMCFHMNDEEKIVYEKTGNLSELEDELTQHGFCRVHKSYLVNMKLVDYIERYQVKMENGITLPIPRDKYQKVKEEYFKIMGDV